jgi:hypothetical protein
MQVVVDTAHPMEQVERLVRAVLEMARQEQQVQIMEIVQQPIMAAVEAGRGKQAQQARAQEVMAVQVL